MSRPQRPEWQLPPGVTRGMWDYARSHPIADDYDDYFAYNRLFDFDEQILEQWLRPDATASKVVADLGCGTGRALIPLVRRGFHGVAVDLSERMLEIVREKADEDDLPVTCLRANLVELDCLADQSVDHAISLFSTLGMIRGRRNRRRALAHVRRIVKPEGIFVVHVHNYWYNLYDPGGPWWLLKNLLQSAFSRDVEAGDKFFNYRGVNNMFLHVFRRYEIVGDLHRAGFVIRDMIPLDVTRHRRLHVPWCFSNLRANGWIIVCQREERSDG